MQQIADWLEKLGMSKYAGALPNKIDVSVLRHLTDQDLKDINVPLGGTGGKYSRPSASLAVLTSVTTELGR